MAVVEHPDFPKTLMGIQGLNPWNILLGFVLLAWIMNRDGRKNPWDMPSNISMLLFAYFALIVLSFVRMAFDMGPFIEYELLQYRQPSTFAGLLSEKIINCLKWVIPGILLLSTSFNTCYSFDAIVRYWWRRRS
jgi:hypothetical protein